MLESKSAPLLRECWQHCYVKLAPGFQPCKTAHTRKNEQTCPLDKLATPNEKEQSLQNANFFNCSNGLLPCRGVFLLDWPRGNAGDAGEKKRARCKFKKESARQPCFIFFIAAAVFITAVRRPDGASRRNSPELHRPEKCT